MNMSTGYLSAAFSTWATGALLLGTCLAEDITTLDGKRYDNVRDLKPLNNGVVFSYGPETNPDRTTVLFRDLPSDLGRKYGYDVFEAGLRNARSNPRISLTLNSAFRLSNLDAAKKRAQAEKKLLGFIMTWDNMFRSARPMGKGGNNDLAGFYTVFHEGLVLVFVRHEDELDKIPAAVQQGFGGPEEGGWAPNMAVVTADCSRFVCEIPLGGKDSDGAVREPIFRAKIATIKQFLDHPEVPVPEAVQPTNAHAVSGAGSQARKDSDPDDLVPGQGLVAIRKIPQQTRLLYGGIAIGALVVLTVSLRFLRKKAS